MLDALYEEPTARALDDRQRMRIAPPRPTPGMFDGILSAAPRGFAGAVNESARVIYRAATAGADETMRRQQAEADDFTAEAIFRRRVELDSERGFVDQQLKAGADYWRPDPQTTGAAAQVVQGFAGLLTKAGIYSVATGSPLAGAALTGADVGGTEFLGLRDDGVDPATAAQVAAVRGASAAVQLALPVAGTTLAKTLALAAAGGPIGYVGENTIAREILRNADYSKLADQIDPFDPVGLTAATLGAGLFGVGAYALRARGSKIAAETPREAAAVTPPQDAVDAALVIAGREAADARRLADPTDLRASAADSAALTKAEQQIARGEPVVVSDVAPVTAVEPPALTAFREAVDAEYREALGAARAEETAARIADEPAGDRELVGTADGAGEVVHRTIGGGTASQGWASATRIRRTSGEPSLVYRGAGRSLTADDFEPGALGFATKQPSSGLGVWFALNAGEAGRYGKVEEFQLDLRNPKVIKADDLPAFDDTAQAIRYREQLRAEGHDGLLISAKHLGGPVHLVAFDAQQVIRPRAEARPQKAAPTRPAAAPSESGAVPTISEKNGGAWLQAADESGTVGGTVRDGALRITFAEVAPGMRGQGRGIALYRALIDEALGRGLRVTSDSTVEGPAVRVYEALERRGYAVRRLEGGGELKPSDEAPEGALFGKRANEPVFEVTAPAKEAESAAPKPGEPPAIRQAPTVEVAAVADDGARISGDEYLRQVEAEAAAADADAGLLQVAAECFLEAA